MVIIINRETDGNKFFYADHPICSSYDEIGVYANNERDARRTIRENYNLNRLPIGYGVYNNNPYTAMHEQAREQNGQEFIDWY